MPGIKSDVTKAAGGLGKKVITKIAQEPFEVLKTAGKQVTGEIPTTPEETETFEGPRKPSEEIKALEQKVKQKDSNLLQALERELKEIREKRKQKEKELSSQEVVPEKPLVEPTLKKSRRLFGFGPKTQAERQKTRVEKPLPPTG